MTANVQITFRDFPPPLLAEERIHERVDRLGKLHPRITSCRIVAEAPADEPAVLAARVRKLDAITPFVRLGDWLPALATLSVVLVSLRRVRAGRL